MKKTINQTNKSNSADSFYDVIVVGAGHAGIEAALAANRIGSKVLMITDDLDRMGSMPCNPSVGGPAKGIVVREIDALGGLMPKVADETALQFKMLNTSKGPGVRSLRVQSDKLAYSKAMKKELLAVEGLDLLTGRVDELLTEPIEPISDKENASEHEDQNSFGAKEKVRGVRLSDGKEILADAVILTTGTYMDASILKGHTKTTSGPEGRETSTALSRSLEDKGIRLFRLKTGTPPRVLRDTIDFSKAEIQPGDKVFRHFYHDTKPEDVLDESEQELCWLIYTTPETHKIINDHLQDSAMYSGLVEGVGPRYCPSIEDKLVRFADKPRHQLFLEPESKDLDTIYIQGFSTSMPEDVQEQMVHSLPGMENAKIVKYAYAIEYDAVDPLQTKPSLENKTVENLFTAGQINGTSGYEEAAGQGLMAGANAALKLKDESPLILKRDEAYIGVLIDDLTTKGTKEPYRLLTSRAEHRLLLRHDNAEIRLAPLAYEKGLISKERYKQILEKWQRILDLKNKLEAFHIKPTDETGKKLEEMGFSLSQGTNALELLKRPKITMELLSDLTGITEDPEIAEQVEINQRYQGYIEKAYREAEKMRRMENKKIPQNIDFLTMDNLSLEARQKLNDVRPLTLGQASRISGVNPADIAILAVNIQRKEEAKA